MLKKHLMSLSLLFIEKVKGNFYKNACVPVLMITSRYNKLFNKAEIKL